MTSLSTRGLWIILPVLLVILFFLDLSLGSVAIPLPDIFRVLTGGSPADPIWKEIIVDFRLTKALTCIVAGAALSIAGLQMQTFFRNPLAGPDVFGLTSGASLAVSLVFMASNVGLTIASSSPWIVAIFASVGSGLVAVAVLLLSKKLKDSASLLIVGLMIGTAAASIVSVLQFVSSAEEQQLFLIWTFGNLGGLNWSEIVVLACMLMIGSVISYSSIKSMNAWLLGDRYAKSLGINLKRSRVWIIVCTSVLTGAVTAFCGPIVFVGLAVPHLVKMLVKTNDHKILVPAVIIFGAALMLFCDVVAQLPGTTSSRVLPINAITSLIGAPVVVWVIMRGRKISV